MLKSFVPTDELELQPFPNGRGPFSGSLRLQVVEQKLPAEFSIRCGRDPQADGLEEDPYVVSVTAPHPFVGYVRWFRDSILAENLASILDAVGYLREDQLLLLGFVEDRRTTSDN